MAYGVTNNPPPLPPRLSSTAWMVAAVGWGAVGGYRQFVNCYYYSAVPSALGLFHANTFAQDLNALLKPLFVGTYANNLQMGSIYTYGWDGAVYHAGFGGDFPKGGLFTSNRSIAYPALIKKWAWVGTGQITGWWHSAVVNSAWATRDFQLTTLGVLQFQNWVNFLASPVTSEGNVWTPCIFSPRGTGELYPVSMVQLMPKLHFFKKRTSTPNGVHSNHDNIWVPQLPTPTPNG